MPHARAARLLAAATLACALPAAAQGTLVTGPGASPRSDFIGGFTFTAANGLNATAGTLLDFGALGTATLQGAELRANRIVDTGGDGAYTLTFSNLIDGFGAEFAQVRGALAISLFNGGTSVGTFSTTFANGGVRFLGVSGMRFDEVRIAGASGGELRADNLVIGANASIAAVPEPGPLALLGIGLAGMAVATRRRQLVRARR
jgi:hypothetical protein